MEGQERDLTRNQRILVSALVWLLVGPLVIGLFFWGWWLGLGLLALAGWTTWDYIRKGDLAGHVAEGMSKQGYVAKGAEEVFGHPDKDRD